MKKNVFLMGLVVFFLMYGIASAEGTDIQPEKAAPDKSIQATEMGPASTSDKTKMTPEGYSEPAKKEAGHVLKDINKNAPAEKIDVTPPIDPEETISGE